MLTTTTTTLARKLQRTTRAIINHSAARVADKRMHSAAQRNMTNARVETRKPTSDDATNDRLQLLLPLLLLPRQTLEANKSLRACVRAYDGLARQLPEFPKYASCEQLRPSHTQAIISLRTQRAQQARSLETTCFAGVHQSIRDQFSCEQRGVTRAHARFLPKIELAPATTSVL